VAESCSNAAVLEGLNPAEDEAGYKSAISALEKVLTMPEAIDFTRSPDD
jgi:hypothetical protein